jgi:small-conductance mechanosensitive channel
MSTFNIFDHLVEHNSELAIILVVLALVVCIGARKLGSRPLAARFPRAAAIVELVLGPAAVIAIGSLARVAANSLGLGAFDEDLRRLTVFATYVAGALVIARLIEVFKFIKTKTTANSRYTGILRGLFYGGCIFAGVVIYLKVQGISITGVWVSTGVLAALAGFALQKTLGDLFSGIALSIEGPFRKGDWLQFEDGSVGQVTDINWRATRLRGWDNATLVIPNGELASRGFKNLHGPAQVYAPWYLIKVPAEVDPRFAKALLLEAALGCKGVLKEPLPVVRISDATTIPYTYMVWVSFPNYPSMFAGREELFREIHYAFKSAGIHISAGIQEWHTKKAKISVAEPPNVRIALKSFDVASQFSDDELDKISSESRYMAFDAGTVILHEGEVSDACYIITSGIVVSGITTLDGAKKTVEELLPGSYFGITSMMTVEPSFVQITAKTDVTVIHVDIECLRSIFAAKPAHADHFAAVVKRRMDAAEKARQASRRPTASLSLEQVLRRIEKTLGGR